MAEAVVSSVVEKIVGCLIEPIQRELGYLFCFNSNIQELETRLDQLKATKNDVQAREDEAKRSWKSLGEAANLWMVDANGKIIEADTVINDKAELQKGCFSIKWCPNIKLRFSLGRKGKKLSLVLDDLLQRGRPYLSQTLLALPMPAIDIRHDHNDDDADFDSRRKPMEEIIELLQDKETRLIGICGMGGIGKTTFANQLLQKVQDMHLFGFHFMLTVSSNPDFSTIQHLALKKLGFNPSSTERVDEEETAQRLRDALHKKKVLIVLDDVWEDFDLNAKGFLLKQSDVESCCKIIYTSRNNGLWLAKFQAFTRKEILLQGFSNKESLDFFIREANLNNDDDDFREKNSIAGKIVDECKGLPLALKVAGSALIGKSSYEWNDMLFSFQNHDQHVDKITIVLETSYNFLKDRNLKLLFLLCCLFREDQEIPIETLYRYAVGLQLFQGVRDLEHVRNRVYTLVNDLIRRNLIINVEAFDDLDGKDERAVKMHDVVRDVGISIASKRENGFSIREYKSVDDFRDTDFEEDSKMISIIFQNKVKKITPPLYDLITESYSMSTFRGSKLQLQLLRLDIGNRLCIYMPQDSFQGMDHLKVLDITHDFNSFGFPSKLSSLSYLANLKMLSLVHLDEDYQPAIRDIQCHSSLEILSFRHSSIIALPNEISQLSNLRVLDLTGCDCLISSGVLSKLTNLEELYMWNGFSSWSDSNIAEDEEHNNTTEEKKDKSIAAELTELNHLCKLSRLEIEVSNIKQMPRNVTLLPSSKLVNFRIRIGTRTPDAFRDYIFEGGERLIWLTNVNDRVLHAFGIIMENKYTDIVLIDCGSITTLPPLVNSSSQTSDNKLVGHLRRIEIRGCNQMMYLNDCNEEFNDLETLKFYDLCMMKSFYKGVYEIHFPALKTLELVRLEQFILPPKLEIPRLEKLIIDSISNLENLCNFLAPSSIKELRIINCPDLKYVFGETENKLFEFSSLRTLELDSLYELTSFVIEEKEKPQRPLFYYDQVSFPCLTNLRIKNLPKISYVVGWNSLQQQEQRYHRANDINERKLQQHVLFPILKYLRLDGLTNLIHIYESNHPNLGEFLAQSLRELRIRDCEKLRYLFSENIVRVAAKHLVFLAIVNCPMMEVVMKNFDENDGGTKSISVPNLQELYLMELPELKRFCDIACSWDLPSLNLLGISSCPKLETLSPGCLKLMENLPGDLNSAIGRLLKIMGG